jgi:hypothetical protein
MRSGLVALGLLLAITSSARAVCESGPVESTFEVDTDGWIGLSMAEFKQESTGGNPGGFLYADNSETVVAQIVAPEKFEGDLRPCAGGTFHFDGRMLGIGGTGYHGPGVDYGNLRITGGGSAGNMVVDLLPGGPPGNTPPTATWGSFSVPFTAASFGVSQTQFEAILANVIEVRLGVEALFGNEVQGIDNVRLEGPPNLPALSGTGTLALAGALGVLGARRLARPRATGGRACGRKAPRTGLHVPVS